MRSPLPRCEISDIYVIDGTYELFRYFYAVQRAEAVAFVVCQSVGLQNGTSSQDYIQLWHRDANFLRQSLESVQQTAAVILGGIAP